MGEILKENTTEKGKWVIIEVADVFLAQDKFESIPDEDLEPEEHKQWEDVEDKTTRNIIKEQIAKAKQEGFPRFWLFTVDQVQKKLKRPLPLGLNGMYLLVFKKS